MISKSCLHECDSASLFLTAPFSFATADAEEPGGVVACRPGEPPYRRRRCEVVIEWPHWPTWPDFIVRTSQGATAEPIPAATIRSAIRRGTHKDAASFRGALRGTGTSGASDGRKPSSGVPRDDLDESPDGEVDHRLRRARAGAVVLDDPDDLPRANGLLRSSPWRIDEERAEGELRKQDAREGARLPAGAGRTARPPIPRRVLAHRSAASPGATWFVRRRRRSA